MTKPKIINAVRKATTEELKTVTVRILPPKIEDSSAGIYIAGKIAQPGELYDLNEFDGADLVSRGHAERV